jgi:hypothetical protein
MTGRKPKPKPDPDSRRRVHALANRIQEAIAPVADGQLQQDVVYACLILAARITALAMVDQPDVTAADMTAVFGRMLEHFNEDMAEHRKRKGRA